MKMSAKDANLDLSLRNEQLYAGCDTQEVAGRLALITPVGEAVNIVGRNAQTLIDELVADGVEEITLTGAMAIWADLSSFTLQSIAFRRVY